MTIGPEGEVYGESVMMFSKNMHRLFLSRIQDKLKQAGAETLSWWIYRHSALGSDAELERLPANDAPHRWRGLAPQLLVIVQNPAVIQHVDPAVIGEVDFGFEEMSGMVWKELHYGLMLLDFEPIVQGKAVLP